MMTTEEEEASDRSVLLFYKYYYDDTNRDMMKFRTESGHYLPLLVTALREYCESNNMKGRLLCGIEGINGSLSAATDATIDAFIEHLQSSSTIIGGGGGGDGDGNCDGDNSGGVKFCNLFCDIDWKRSSVDEDTASKCRSIFPDLKVVAVKEIVSSGGAVDLEEIPKLGGKHLTPEEFHAILSGSTDISRDDIALIDVRNTFEYDVGHFVQSCCESNITTTTSTSSSDLPAQNPAMVNFPQFDQFCRANAAQLKNKKTLVYCTGGIRCEKASALLKKYGIHDVNQLQGGIHRYLERYGNSQDCLFKGKLMTFDARVSYNPCTSESEYIDSRTTAAVTTVTEPTIVGKCLECNGPYDTLSGAILCTVCRDLVLVCPTCNENVREYHCKRHIYLKNSYFTFLECFDDGVLQQQQKELLEIRDSGLTSLSKSEKRTITKQVGKIQTRINQLIRGEVKVELDAPRKCRTCSDQGCDGLCWGFWKKNRLKTDLKERARNNKNKNECILFCCTNTPTISEIESNLNLN